MAKYEHLPIYKAAFDFNLYVERIVHNFSRYHKYTLGTELRERARTVVKLIVRANNVQAEQRREKCETLQELREELEQLKLTIRLSKEVKAFHNFNAYHVAINHIINLSKQNEGWLKSLSQADGEAVPDGKLAPDGHFQPHTDRA